MAFIKPIVNSWDVFDTLLTRFVPDPMQVFALIDRRHPGAEFQQRRLAAQAGLDTIGKPYVIYDIYRHMAENGMAPELAKSLLIEELATERAMLLPVRSALSQVMPHDLLISDMYLPSEIISSLLADMGDLHAMRPVIRSNWGKHSGTIWPKILQRHVIRTHYGDNAISDAAVPQKYGINTVLLRNVELTQWEKSLVQMGLGQLGLIQRETRLRSLGVNAGLFETLACGPYLSLLLGYAGYLVNEFGEAAIFGFLSRDCDDLGRIFRSVYPGVNSFNVDLSRRLIQDAEMDSDLRNALPADCVLADCVSTGRSVQALLERIGVAGRVFVTLLFLDHLLPPPRATDFAGRYVHQSSEFGGRHYPLELLLQSAYPPVAGVIADAASGGLVRSFGAAEYLPAEASMIHGRCEIVTNFLRVIRQRGLPALTKIQSEALMTAALEAILTSDLQGSLFPSFIAREKFAPF